MSLLFDWITAEFGKMHFKSVCMQLHVSKRKNKKRIILTKDRWKNAKIWRISLSLHLKHWRSQVPMLLLLKSMKAEIMLFYYEVQLWCCRTRNVQIRLQYFWYIQSNRMDVCFDLARKLFQVSQKTVQFNRKFIHKYD